jgi:hypothetical protein
VVLGARELAHHAPEGNCAGGQIRRRTQRRGLAAIHQILIARRQTIDVGTQGFV